MTSLKLAVVIPCYKVKAHIAGVINSVPEQITTIYAVDDACPEGSGAFIRETITDHRVKLLTHGANQGVGGAVITGYRQALLDGADIVIKIDGDGQMDAGLIPLFIKPILEGRCDYTKGNRFYSVDDVRSMPTLRLLGNAGLSFLTKLSGGYWHLFDPTNGYTAIHATALKRLALDKIAKRYFFESDMLFRLNIIRAVVEDVPMTAVYNDEESNLKIGKIVLPFLGGHLKNFCKRVFYNYFLRDFSIASIELLFGAPMLVFGLIFGVTAWSASAASGVPASAGTVMLSALPTILGVQLLLSFLHYDIQAVPKTALHEKLTP